jgi:hypothetical protein
MTTDIDNPTRRERQMPFVGRAPLSIAIAALNREEPPGKKKRPWGSAQPIEKSRFDEGNSMITFGCLWLGIAQSRRICENLASALKNQIRVGLGGLEERA